MKSLTMLRRAETKVKSLTYQRRAETTGEVIDLSKMSRDNR